MINHPLSKILLALAIALAVAGCQTPSRTATATYTKRARSGDATLTSILYKFNTGADDLNDDSKLEIAIWKDGLPSGSVIGSFFGATGGMQSNQPGPNVGIPIVRTTKRSELNGAQTFVRIKEHDQWNMRAGLATFGFSDGSVANVPLGDADLGTHGGWGDTTQWTLSGF